MLRYFERCHNKGTRLLTVVLASYWLIGFLTANKRQVYQAAGVCLCYVFCTLGCHMKSQIMGALEIGDLEWCCEHFAPKMKVDNWHFGQNLPHQRDKSTGWSLSKQPVGDKSNGWSLSKLPVEMRFVTGQYNVECDR